MKWYYWILIAIILTVVTVLIIRRNKMQADTLAQIAANTPQPKNTFDPFNLTPITT